VRFFFATVWAGVNAPHCPITCPNRRIPKTLCAMRPKFIIKYCEGY